MRRLSALILLLLTCSCTSNSNDFYFASSWDKNLIRVTPDRFDERKFVIGQIDAIDRPDLLLMGSSRLMQADSKMFSSKIQMFNAAISVGTIPDFAAIWQEIKNENKSPKYVIISLDPWVFNRNNQRNEWKSNEKLYQQFQSGHVDLTIQRIKKYASNFLRKSNEWPVTSRSEMQREESGKRGDGSTVYPESYNRPQSVLEVHTKAQRYLRGCVFSMCDWEFDEKNYQTLLSLLRDFYSRKIEVLLILPPYHPIVYRELMKKDEYKNPLMQVRDAYEKKLKSESNIAYEFCDILDPSTAGCDEGEFTDGMHYQYSCMQKIIQSCVGKFNHALLP